jgi:hypothetical protein
VFGLKIGVNVAKGFIEANAPLRAVGCVKHPNIELLFHPCIRLSCALHHLHFGCGLAPQGTAPRVVASHCAGPVDISM